MENKFKCAYPNCKKEGKYSQSFELINEENANVELLFCEYHHLIVMGGHFKAKVIKNNDDSKDFEIKGPFKEVEICEQVIAAREMVAALTSQENATKLKTKK